jgi:hypothetical protein
MTRFNCAVLSAMLLAGTLTAADDPFCGKWKLDKEKSKISGEQVKIEDLGNNSYKFTFNGVSDTVKADGTDQPIHYGRTRSLTKEGSNTFKFVVKKDGKVIDSGTETLSDDGNMITIKGTNAKPDGTTNDYEVKTKRVGSGSGWAGTWESTNVELSSPDEFEIKPYGAHGLTFYTPAWQDTLSMNFDGKDYPEKGPRVPAGSMSSGKRSDPHTLEIAGKINGKVVEHDKYEVSEDGKTLTMTVHETNEPNPLTIVFDKM